MPGWNANHELVWREARHGLDDLEEWARLAREDPYAGYCLGCGAHRRRSEAREVRPAGYPLSAAVQVCATCGQTLDELPF